MNSSTNMTCPRCQNVISMPDSMLATIKNAHSFILTLRVKLRIARGMFSMKCLSAEFQNFIERWNRNKLYHVFLGMTEGSAAMVHTADIDMCDVFYA